MAMTLDEIADVVRGVARDCAIDVDVVGVTRSEGDAAYIEVLLDVRATGRLAVGLDGNGPLDDLQAEIASKLDGAIRGDSAAG